MNASARKKTPEENLEDGKKVLADPKKLTIEGNEEARLLFEEAIKDKPNYSEAYAELAYLYVREYQEGWALNLKRAEGLAKLAGDTFEGHWNLASVYWNQGEFDKSFAEYVEAEADRIKGKDPDLAADKAEALIYSGKPKAAITEIEKAILLKKHDIPYWYWWNLGRAHYMAKRYQKAIDAIGKIKKAKIVPPNDVLLITAASKAQLGDLDDARTEMEEFSKNDPEFSIAKAAERHFRYDSDRQHWLDGLRQAGLKEK